MTRSTPSRSLRLVTGLLAAAGVAVAATAAALPRSAGTLSDTGVGELGGLAPSVASSNVTYGERVKGGELTRFVLAGIDLYRAATDDPDHVNVDDGPQIAVIDVTDPDRPFTRSVTDVGDVTTSTHTVQCVDQADCRYAYTAGNGGTFSILDRSDLDARSRWRRSGPPRPARTRCSAGAPATTGTSTARFGWHTGSGGAAAFDVSDPTAPVLVNATDENGTAPGWNDFVSHNSMRPNASAFTAGAAPSVANGNVLLVTEEDYLSDGDEIACERAGSFQTWYVPDLDGAAYRAANPDGTAVGVATVTPLDATNAPAEFGVGGVSLPAGAFCSAHWFDVHQDGWVAQGWYGAGLQILDVRDARDIRQLGYATGLATEVWDAYWVPVRNSAGKAVPGKKTDLVYTAGAVRGIEVFEVTLPTT